MCKYCDLKEDAFLTIYEDESQMVWQGKQHDKWYRLIESKGEPSHGVGVPIAVCEVCGRNLLNTNTVPSLSQE